MKKVWLLALAMISLTSIATAGQVKLERWNLSNGTVPFIADLLAWTETAPAPSVTGTLATLEMPNQNQEYYAAKISGWLVPPANGSYTFYIASDDEAQLWLSPSEDPASVALLCQQSSGWVAWRQWEAKAEQKSAPVTLKGGKPYAVIVVQREGYGGDFVNVGWTGPVVGTAITVVSGDYLVETHPYKIVQPVPADGAVDVTGTVLSWQAAPVVTGATYNVYAGTDPNNLSAKSTGQSDLSYTLGASLADLGYDTTWYWRVDVNDPNTGGTPVTVMGDKLSFTTKDALPFITEEPASQSAKAGVEVVLSCQADSVGDTNIQYQWFKVVEEGDDLAVTVLGADQNEYTIAALSESDTGYYYCQATNSYGVAESARVRVYLQAGLIHRYSFNDGTADDSVGGANGTLINTTGTSTIQDGELTLGNDGTQESNAGTGDYVDLPNGIISALNTQMTIEVWYTWKHDVNENNHSGQWQRIFDFGSSNEGEDFSSGASNSYYIIGVPYGGNGVLRTGYRRGPDGNEQVIDGHAVARNEESYMAVVWNEEVNRVELYQDGELVGSNVTHFSLSDIVDVNNWLGRAQWNDRMYNGSINELRIWDEAISGGWIKARYQAGPDNPFPADACVSAPANDLNGDCAIDLEDFIILANEWLYCGLASCLQ